MSVGGRALRLTATEFELLRLLTVHAGQVLTYEVLIRRLWSESDPGDPDRVRTFVKQAPAQARRRSGPPGLHLQRAPRRLPRAGAGRVARVPRRRPADRPRPRPLRSRPRGPSRATHLAHGSPSRGLPRGRARCRARLRARGPCPRCPAHRDRRRGARTRPARRSPPVPAKGAVERHRTVYVDRRAAPTGCGAAGTAHASPAPEAGGGPPIRRFSAPSPRCTRFQSIRSRTSHTKVPTIVRGGRRLSIRPTDGGGTHMRFETSPGRPCGAAAGAARRLRRRTRPRRSPREACRRSPATRPGAASWWGGPPPGRTAPSACWATRFLSYDMDAGALDADFTGIVNIDRNAAHSTTAVTFAAIPVGAQGTFAAGEAGDRIQGGFYGPGHAETGGHFRALEHRRRLRGQDAVAAEETGRAGGLQRCPDRAKRTSALRSSPCRSAFRRAPAVLARTRRATAAPSPTGCSTFARASTISMRRSSGSLRSASG